MKTQTGILIMIGLFVLGLAPKASALTTDELVRLKKTGLSDDTIVFMAENDYNEAEKVLLLKEVGYKDDSILAIVKSEVKKRSLPAASSVATPIPSLTPAGRKPDFQTPAKVSIIRYWMYRDKPLLQNKEAVDDAQISMTGKTMGIMWEKKDGMSPINAFQKEPFTPPFYLELSKDDVFGSGKEGYGYRLQTILDHRYKDNLNRDGYWVVYLEPKDAKLIDYVKGALKT